ncbi:kinase-like domain-containing protein [Gymnopilus junonius]|uniref:Kinase-like domain-containing protein n=1 Tax=Gymnopilus junonius TaxID=109634 RepID=A0A9P5THJ8_GYMJU|nr:kinase-like domain-containing protein [Gymnopilus junonius]
MSLFPEELLDSPIGYFPGRLNQTLNNGRWTIIRKLGWGPCSSCWLAVDPKDPEDIEAVKVYTVTASKKPSSMNECDILQKIIMSLLNNDMSEVKYLPLHAVKKAAGEVASTLSSLHEKAIIHGGQKAPPDFARVGLYLSNFLHAQILSDNVSLDQSSTFLPPEASIDGAKIDMKADVWMLGCTIYTLIIGHPPFGDSQGPLTREKVEEVTANIKDMISATKAMSLQDAKKTTSVIKICHVFYFEDHLTY